MVILSRRGSSSIFVDRTHNNLAQATNNRKRKEKENGSPSISTFRLLFGWMGARIGHFSHFFVPLVLFSSCVYFLFFTHFFFVLPSSIPLGPSGRDGSFRNRIMSHPSKKKMEMAEYPVLFSFSFSYPAGPLGREMGGGRTNRFPLFLETSQRSNSTCPSFRIATSRNQVKWEKVFAPLFSRMTMERSFHPQNKLYTSIFCRNELWRIRKQRKNPKQTMYCIYNIVYRKRENLSLLFLIF